MLTYDPELNIGDIDLDDNALEDLMYGKNVKVLLRTWTSSNGRRIWRVIGTSSRPSGRGESSYPRAGYEVADPMGPDSEENRSPHQSRQPEDHHFHCLCGYGQLLYDHLAQRLQAQGIYTALITGTGDNRSTLPIPKTMKTRIKLSDLSTALTLFSPRSKSVPKSSRR